MSEFKDDTRPEQAGSTADIRSIVQEAIEEFAKRKREESEPAYKVELQEERRRREQLESQVKDLLQKTRESEQEIARARMTGAVKDELQKQGVTKVDLAYRVMKDEIRQAPNGDYVGRTREGDLPIPEFVKRFVDENPEFLPPRIAGGSGTSGAGQDPSGVRFDIDAIRPGMSSEERKQLHAVIADLATRTFKS